MLKNLLNKIIDEYVIRKNPISYAKKIGVTVGDNCRFISISRKTFGSEPFLVKVGNHVTITAGVRFITHDGGVWVFRESEPTIDLFGPIIIGNNTFIGLNAIILPNVKIGDNCIIGAGSVVTKDVESNSIVAGIPAKKISNVNDYRKKLESKAFFIRELPVNEKQKILKKHFFEE